MLRLRTIAGAVAACLVAGLIFSCNLGGYALWDPDEGRHAEIAREIFTAKDLRGWIVPSLNAEPYYHKPILFYWLVDGAYSLGGVNELAARAVPAAAALGTVLAVYLFAARAWSAGAGLAAAVVLVTAGEFAVLGRLATLDMLLTLWVTLGLVAFHRWTLRAEVGASLAPAAFSAALGMLTKGLVAPVLIGGVGLIHLAVTRQLRLLAHARWLRSAALFIAVAGPWYLAAWLVEPNYLREFFLLHQYDRFLQSTRHMHPGPVYYYIPMLLICFFPWSLLLPATVRGTLTRSRRGPVELFCLCWAAGILVFFSLSRGKLGTYILPSLPPLALLTGRYVSDLVTRPTIPTAERRLIGAGMILAAGVCFAAAPILFVLSWYVYGGAWTRTSILATVLIPVGATLVLLVRRRHHGMTPIALAIGFFLAFLVFYRWAAPSISAVRSGAPLAAAIAASSTGGVEKPPIVVYGVRSPSLLFYVQRPVSEIDRPGKLKRFLAEHSFVFVVTSPRHVPDVLAAGARFAWHTGGRHVLYASEPPPAERHLRSPGLSTDGEGAVIENQPKQ
jgi:4-amino-4-deoxy-L-arabinose transferase-like glycosyltransferase